MENYALVLSEVLLVPYVAWGIRMLTHRYRDHEETGAVTETLTLLGVVVFVVVEISLFQTWLYENTVIYIFTLLGLMVSVGALYGHMAISLTSRLIVEAISPSGDSIIDTPRLGPIEALERQRDYEGALQESLVIARIYPREPSVHLHIAENLLRLKRPQEAATWLERAIRHVDSAERNLTVVNRLVEVYHRELHQPGLAATALEAYLRRFPKSPDAASVRSRLDGLGQKQVVKVADSLAALDESPVAEPPEPVEHLGTGALLRLEPLDAAAADTTVSAGKPAVTLARSSSRRKPARLAPLDEVVVEEEAPEEEPTPTKPFQPGLQSLDDAPLAEEAPAETLPRRGTDPGRPLGLQSLEEAPLEGPEDFGE